MAAQGYGAGQACWCGDLRAYVVHVETADGVDQLVERRRGQGAGLAEHHDPVAERHQRGGSSLIWSPPDRSRSSSVLMLPKTMSGFASDAAS